jgi:uncharacterized damage-inducible protein DinB
MNGTAAIRTALESTRHLTTWFVSDLSDADILVRPAPAANHIAWQLGHLVSAERHLAGKMLPDAPYPELPAGFDEQHSNKNTAADSGFATKAVYVDLFTRARQATLDALARLSDADLERPTVGSMAQFAPTLGALLVLTANHTMMHAGQFSVVRRKLGKPVLF